MIGLSVTTTTVPLANQARYMAWRAVIRTARQPIVIVPPLVFPLFLLAINASGLDAASEIPGFPADSYLAFALAFPFMQGAIFATNTAGTNIAQDIGSGFFNRLSLTPVRGSSLLAGQLTGVLLVGQSRRSRSSPPAWPPGPASRPGLRACS